MLRAGCSCDDLRWYICSCCWEAAINGEINNDNVKADTTAVPAPGLRRMVVEIVSGIFAQQADSIVPPDTKPEGFISSPNRV